MKKRVFALAAGFLAFFCLHTVGSAASPPADSVRFCAPFDYEEWRREHPRPAGKKAADLNAGEPRTVRMIYFLPNDRGYRAVVVRNLKARILEVQAFYSASMQAMGHGDETFAFETDTGGEPLVHRVDGRHADSHYLDDTVGKVLEEIEERGFDPEQNVYLILIDNSTGFIDRRVAGKGTRIGKIGGIALVTSNEADHWNDHNTVSHELGHAFGLQHDFRDQAYVMSYGHLPDSELSACNAGFLAAHPYFNLDIPIESAAPPAIERVSPLAYAEYAESVDVRLEVSDSDELHQAILFTVTLDGHIAAGFYEVKMCRGLAGERAAVVTFVYDGVSPSARDERFFTSLASPDHHPLAVQTVDAAGNVSIKTFTLVANKSESERPRPGALEIISGDNQRGAPGAALAQPLVVEVNDQQGNPLPGVNVAFAVASGGGRLGGRFTVRNMTTDANGRAESILTLGPGLGANAVKASVGDLAEVTFHAVSRGQSIAPPSREGASIDRHLPDGAFARLGTGVLSASDRAVAFSPDGRLLAVAKSPGVWVYDATTYGRMAMYPAENKIASLAFSPDGKSVAVAEQVYNDVHFPFNADNVSVWDVATGKRSATVAQEGWGAAVAFSPDGKLLATADSYEDVTLWDSETWRRVATYEGEKTSTWLQPVPVSFSPDGAVFALGSIRGTVNLWDVVSGSQIARLEGHTYEIASIAFSPDGAMLASGSFDRTVRLWDVAARASVATLRGHTKPVNSVAFSGDGTTLVSGSDDGTVKLWDVTSTRNTATLEGHAYRVRSVAYSPESDVLAAGVDDGSVKLWDVTSRGVIENLDQGGSFTSAAYSGDGSVLALGSGRTIRLWDAATVTEVAALELEGRTDRVTSLTFLRDGVTLASGSREGIYFWDVTARVKKDFLPGRDFLAGPCNALTASADGKKIASIRESAVTVWDLETGGQTVIPAPGPSSFARTVSFSPDGGTLAWKTLDGFCYLWDLARQETVATMFLGAQRGLLPGGFVLFSPDGRFLVTGSSYTPRGLIGASLRVYDAGTNAVVAEFEIEDTGQIRSGAFSPKGALLAAGTYHGKILLLDMARKEIAAILRQSEGQGSVKNVEALSFSPDGAILASASDDGTALLWDMSSYIHAPTQSSAPDFDGDGSVGFLDFFLFARVYGTSRGDMEYSARYDLDGDGAIGFSDFLVFAESFGKKTASS